MLLFNFESSRFSCSTSGGNEQHTQKKGKLKQPNLLLLFFLSDKKKKNLLLPKWPLFSAATNDNNKKLSLVSVCTVYIIGRGATATAAAANEMKKKKTSRQNNCVKFEKGPRETYKTLKE